MNKFRNTALSLLITALTAATVTGCSSLPFINDGKTDDASSSIASEEDEEENSASETDASDTSASETAGSTDSDTEIDGREMTSDELSSIEEDMNTIRYNGFLTAEFDNVENIWWDDVLYNGADITGSDIDHDKLVTSYIKGAGLSEDDLWGDVEYINPSDLEKFVHDTTGMYYEDVKHPISWSYLKDLDVYVAQRSDTNYSRVKCLSGTVEGNRYSIKYITDAWEQDNAEYSEDETDSTVYRVIMDKTSNGYRFISNEWSPKGDKSEAIKEIYDGLIKKYADAVSARQNLKSLRDSNCSELCAGVYSDGDPMDIIGYYFGDIDGDGIDELFIGANSSDGDKVIFDAYHIHKGSWSRLFISSDDTKYYLTKDGTIYEETYSENGNESVLKNKLSGSYKFVYPVSGALHDMDGAEKWIYSDDGYPYDDDSKEITQDQFESYRKKARESYIKINYTPLSAIK